MVQSSYRTAPVVLSLQKQIGFLCTLGMSRTLCCPYFGILVVAVKHAIVSEVPKVVFRCGCYP